MLDNNPAGRYLLRCSLYGAGAFIVALQIALPGVSGDELVEAGISGLAAAFAYAGIGAAVPAVEPHIGNKLDASSQ